MFGGLGNARAVHGDREISAACALVGVLDTPGAPGVLDALDAPDAPVCGCGVCSTPPLIVVITFPVTRFHGI